MIRIEAIIIFGSAATGKDDNLSDIDICVVKGNQFDLGSLKTFIRNKIELSNNNASFELVDYTEEEFDLMIKKGSLFIHHLKNDGLVLIGENFLREKYKNLKEFDSFETELNYYYDIYMDLIDSRKEIQRITNFDFSLVFTLVRNICILLSVYNHSPEFGRKSAYEYCFNRYERFPVSFKLFSFLETKKMNYERGLDIEILEDFSFEKINYSVNNLFKLAKDEFRY